MEFLIISIDNFHLNNTYIKTDKNLINCHWWVFWIKRIWGQPCLNLWNNCVQEHFFFALEIKVIFLFPITYNRIFPHEQTVWSIRLMYMSLLLMIKAIFRKCWWFFLDCETQSSFLLIYESKHIQINNTCIDVWLKLPERETGLTCLKCTTPMLSLSTNSFIFLRWHI